MLCASGEEEEEEVDMYADMTQDRVKQFNFILDDINRKFLGQSAQPTWTGIGQLKIGWKCNWLWLVSKIDWCGLGFNQKNGPSSSWQRRKDKLDVQFKTHSASLIEIGCCMKAFENNKNYFYLFYKDFILQIEYAVKLYFNGQEKLQPTGI